MIKAAYSILFLSLVFCSFANESKSSKVEEMEENGNKEKAVKEKLPEANFLFPLDISPSVSGSFAELRNNHFHSGIDLSTLGKIGVPVKNMEMGKVSRIKISSVGYGNALYIAHPNGYTTVYAHLHKYAPKIDSIITAQQYKIQSFDIDFFPTENISVDRGEIIGYSGNSGSSGGPHLHYEIRDSKTEEPINPFSFQDIIKDDVPPKILTIRIYPLNETSTVNGSTSPKNFEVVFFDDAYHLKGNSKIYASGNIGVGIEMLDYMTGSWKKCGVQKLNMKVDSVDYFGWTLERFSFNESRYINSHIDYAYKTNHGKRIERIFRQPGNHLSIYDLTTNDGIVSMNSTRAILIQASDAANNTSQLQFELFQDNRNTIFKSTKNTKLSYSSNHLLRNENMTCFVPKGALYEDTNISFTTKVDNNHGLVYQVGSTDIPLHKNIRIAVSIPESYKIPKNKLCLAKIDKGNKKEYAGGRFENDSLVLLTRDFDKYTIAIDTTPPTIVAHQNIRGRVFQKNSIISFTINDDLSGVSSYNGYLNDEWTLFEYDAKTKKLTCPLSKAPIKKGVTYELKLMVKDNCGNETTLESSFTIGS